MTAYRLYLARVIHHALTRASRDRTYGAALREIMGDPS